MRDILVIGHKNPDTDAICSAIGYAEFKHRTGTRNVQVAPEEAGGRILRMTWLLVSPLLFTSGSCHFYILNSGEQKL